MRAFIVMGVAVLLAAAPGTASGADDALRRIVMLPLVDRATILAELATPVARVQEIASHPSVIIIEAGPVDKTMKPLDLAPIGRHPLVDHVSVRTQLGADALTYVRLEITLSASCSHHVRMAGSRIYIDLTPTADPASRSQPLAAVPAKRPRAPVSARARPAVANTGRDVEAGYRTLESYAMARGRELTRRSDVKELLKLKDEIIRRDEALGRRNPDLVERLLSEVARHTTEARAAQLEKDRRALLDAR